jgi:hypothetical protein
VAHSGQVRIIGTESDSHANLLFFVRYFAKVLNSLAQV